MVEKSGGADVHVTDSDMHVCRWSEQMLQNMHGEKKLMKMQTSSFIAYKLSKI